MASGTEACLQHDGCFHTAVLERRAGGCLFWHDTCNDNQQILAVYWSAAPARDSAEECVAPASHRDLVTRYAQWDNSLRILLSDTDSAVDDGGGMCRAGLAGLADDARAGDDDQGYGHLNSGGNDTAATTATVTTAAATTAAGTTAAATTAVETAPAATTGGFNSGVPLQFRCRLRGDIGGVVSASLVSLVTCRLVLLSEAARATLGLLVTHLLTDFMTMASAQMVIFPGLVWQDGHVQGHAALNMRPQRASRLAVTSASSLWLHIGKSTIAQETVTCLSTAMMLSSGRIRHWMYCWTVDLTSIGRLMVTASYRGRGAVSPNPQY